MVSRRADAAAVIAAEIEASGLRAELPETEMPEMDRGYRGWASGTSEIRAGSSLPPGKREGGGSTGVAIEVMAFRDAFQFRYVVGVDEDAP